MSLRVDAFPPKERASFRGGGGSRVRTASPGRRPWHTGRGIRKPLPRGEAILGVPSTNPGSPDPGPAFAEPWWQRGGVFDFEAWPVPPEHRAAFEERRAAGRRRMAGARVVVTGLVRDAASALPRVAPQIEALVAGFSERRIFLFENDSQDATVAFLEGWARRSPDLGFASERLGRPRHPATRDPARMADMADYRNRCQRFVLEHHPDFDYVIVLDTDLVGYDRIGVEQAFGWGDWDVLAAKGVSRLRDRFLCPDAFAFRDDERQPPRSEAMRIQTIVPPRGAPLLPLRSCFGGLAIYRMKAFAAGRYGGHDCEHVTFHDSLHAAGFGRLFMDPSLLTLYPDFVSLTPKNARRHLDLWDREAHA